MQCSALIPGPNTTSTLWTWVRQHSASYSRRHSFMSILSFIIFCGSSEECLIHGNIYAFILTITSRRMLQKDRTTPISYWMTRML